MIPRFSRPEMAAIWTDENKFRNWLEIELLACEAWAKAGVVPADAPARIRAKASFNIPRIDEIEREVRHDVIAFLTCVNESLGEDGRHMHIGMTSSDIIDTGFSLQLRQSAGLILAALDAVLAALKKQAQAHRDTVCIGRSHGIHAEPTSFGLKMAGHYAAFARAKKRMLQARDEISVCAISGAVGTYATLGPDVEAYVAEKLGLAPETVSTQVIPRDRHAAYFAALGLIASLVENLAVEIRHLQRSEVREVEEYFNAGQKGSSAMPHKRNPVLTENLTGLARLIRGHVVPAMENVVLWHERDISHSSVERIMAPDANILADFALHRLAGVIDKLLVYPERMKKNLDSLGGLVYSQSVLLELTQAGMQREAAYAIVQENAMKVWAGEGDFLSRLKADSRVPLSDADYARIFDVSRFLKYTGAVIDRALAA